MASCRRMQYGPKIEVIRPNRRIVMEITSPRWTSLLTVALHSAVQAAASDEAGRCEDISAWGRKGGDRQAQGSLNHGVERRHDTERVEIESDDVGKVLHVAVIR